MAARAVSIPNPQVETLDGNLPKPEDQQFGSGQLLGTDTREESISLGGASASFSLGPQAVFGVHRCRGRRRLNRLQRRRCDSSCCCWPAACWHLRLAEEVSLPPCCSARSHGYHQCGPNHLDSASARFLLRKFSCSSFFSLCSSTSTSFHQLENEGKMTAKVIVTTFFGHCLLIFSLLSSKTGVQTSSEHCSLISS